MHTNKIAIALCSMLALSIECACGGGGEGDAEAAPRALRVYHDPYHDVDWTSDSRLKAQLHDHIRLDPNRIRAYDAAGYDVLAPIDYSGAPNLSVALTRRLWPIESVLSPDFLQSLSHISVWFPSAEEVGISTMHVDSPFLTTYIEAWDPSRSAVKQSWQYQTPTELFSLIRAGGGLPIWAHPWEPGQRFDQTPGIFGVEIYNAFAEARRRQGVSDYVTIDRSRVLLENWDRALATNQGLIGIAVNDHFGPLPDMPVDDDIRDSGKVIVFAKAKTMAAYREALEHGAVLAVRDMGRIKDKYPTVRSISVEPTLTHIDTDGQVSWIANGGTSIGSGADIPYSALPSGTTYIRAEIRNADGSVIYTQAFSVRPVGDADGDGDVDSQDEQICAQVRQSQEQNPDRVAACGG